MKLSAYPKYKASGIDWLGDMPMHWETPALGTRYTVELGKMLDDSRITGKHLVSYLRNVDVQWDCINTADLPQMDIASYERDRFTVRPGDLLVCEGGEVGRTATVDPGASGLGYQKALHRLRPRRSTEFPRFQYFSMFAAAGSGAFVAGGNPNTIPHLTAIKLRRYRLPAPPIDEQRAIADFLDRETARLDTLVGKKRELIEKLKEKRTVLISRTVTRGLNRSAKLKPSGIEWLGDIPEHWEVKKIRHVALLRSGENITSEELEDGGDYPVFGGNGLRGYSSRFTHEGNYVLIGRQGALCGNINYASGRFWASEHAVVVTPTTKFATTWLGELLRTMNLNQYSVSAAQPGLSVDSLSTLKIPLPPAPEQSTMADYLDRETAKIDKMMEKVEAAIERLQEYRTALITAAVTGKIDVRKESHG